MFNLFSERNKPKTNDEIFVYDEFPEKLRNQLIFILEDLLDEDYNSYYEIHRALCKEQGKLSLNPIEKSPTDNPKIILKRVIRYEEDITIILDLIELSLRFKLYKIRNDGWYLKNFEKKINEINIRFKESSVGYNLVNGNFIRMDSKYTFSEIIEETVHLTFNKKFKTINDEFLDAFKEYQDGDNKDCLVKCLKSLETTLKIICNEKIGSMMKKTLSKNCLRFVILIS